MQITSEEFWLENFVASHRSWKTKARGSPWSASSKRNTITPRKGANKASKMNHGNGDVQMTARSRQKCSVESVTPNARSYLALTLGEHANTDSRTKQSLPSVSARSPRAEKRVRRAELGLNVGTVEPNELPENSCEHEAQKPASVGSGRKAAERKDQSAPVLNGPLLPHREHSAGAARHTVATQWHQHRDNLRPEPGKKLQTKKLQPWTDRPDPCCKS